MYWKVVTPDLLGSHKTIAMRESTKGSKVWGGVGEGDFGPY